MTSSSRFLHGDVRETLPAIGERFQIIYSDPPWQYADRRLVRQDGKDARFGFGAANHYPTMPTKEIAAIDVASIAAERCHLYMWTTCPMLFPDAIQVMQGWGFEFITVAHVWVKVNPALWQDAKAEALQQRLIPPTDHEALAFLNALTFFGTGFYSAANTEFVLLGRQKNTRPFHFEQGRKAPQVIYAPIDRHSRKPEIAQTYAEWMYPEATSRIELFGRRRRAGWTVAGNEEVFDEYDSKGDAVWRRK